MGFFSGLKRFFISFLNKTSHDIDKQTEKLITSSPEAIRAHFRRNRETVLSNYKQLRTVIVELQEIQKTKQKDLERCKSTIDEIEKKMQLAIDGFKQYKDERFKEGYAKLGVQLDSYKEKYATITQQLASQESIITTYIKNLDEMKEDIDKSMREEAETIADILTNQRIQKLSGSLMLENASVEEQNMQLIRNVRNKSKIAAELSLEGIKASTALNQETKLIEIAKSKKHLEDFATRTGHLVVDVEDISK